MDLKTLAREMRETALKHVYTPPLEASPDMPICAPVTERVEEVEGRCLRFIFTKNVLTKESHGFSAEFWHLSLSDNRGLPLDQRTVERILAAFFDTDKPIERNYVPGTALQFSQILKIAK